MNMLEVYNWLYYLNKEFILNINLRMNMIFIIEVIKLEP